MSTEKGRGVKFYALLIGLVVFTSAVSSAGTWWFANATLPTADGTWGEWFRDAYLWVSTALHLDSGTVGKLIYLNAGKNATSSGIDVGTGDDLNGVDDSSFQNVTTANLYANSTLIRNTTGTYQNRTGSILYPTTGSRFIIWNDTGIIYCKNTHNGSITRYTNSSTAIAFAYANLTPSRTWKETIILEGFFTVSITVSPPSYSRTVLEGKIKAADDTQINVVTLDTVHDVEWLGGEIDGNQAGTHYSADFTKQTGIWLWYSYSNLVDGVYIHDCWADGLGIRYAASVDNIIQNCNATNVGSSSFEVLTGASRNSFINCYGTTVAYAGGYAIMNGFEIYSDDNSFTNCYAINCGNNPAFNFRGTASRNTLTNCYAIGCISYGFQFQETVFENVLTNCIAKGCSKGFVFSGTVNCTTLTNCQAIQNTNSGFDVEGTLTNSKFINCISTKNNYGWYSTSVSYNDFIACKATKNSNYGWRFDNARYLQFISCDSIDNSVSGDGTADGFLIVAGTDLIFQNCRAISTTGTRQGTGFKESGACDRNQYISCTASGNKNSQFTILGAADKLHYNTGYVTENSGTSSIASGTTSIAFAHGLSATPVASWFTITFTENPTNLVSSWWLTCNATHAVLNVNTDPGVSNLDFGWKAINP